MIPGKRLLRADRDTLGACATELVVDAGDAICECDAVLVTDFGAQAIAFALAPVNDDHVVFSHIIE
jgi:hypothetical protein